MFDVGGGELILIVLAVIVLFGPKKIPEVAQMFSKGMRKVRDAQNQFQTHLNDIKSEIDLPKDINEAFNPKPVRNVENVSRDSKGGNPAFESDKFYSELSDKLSKDDAKEADNSENESTEPLPEQENKAVDSEDSSTETVKTEDKVVDQVDEKKIKEEPNKDTENLKN